MTLGEEVKRMRHCGAYPVAVVAGPVAVRGGQRALAVPPVRAAAGVCAATTREVGDPCVYPPKAHAILPPYMQF